jgi:hypothetical protein
MHASTRPPARLRLSRALVLALVATLLGTGLASAFSGNWTSPTRVFKHDFAPTHSLAIDGAGHAHIATERGSGGIWYVTNASGSWTECQLSSGNDRSPSIAVDGAVVHIAFARRDAGDEGVFTASSDRPAAAAGCGWALTRRLAGDATQVSMAARAGTLSIAVRTAGKKLRFLKGPAATTAWTINELIDGSCCTSAVDLALTSSGSPRVAYGDGAGTAAGLKFGVRTSKGWKKSKAHGGRVKQVDLTLDQTPGLFGQPPSNAPRIAYVVKKQGTYLAMKSSAGSSGGWAKRYLSKSFGPVALTHHSNVTYIVYVKSGDLRYARASGGIWYGGSLSGSGRDGKPQLVSGQLTFARSGTAAGVYHTRTR